MATCSQWQQRPLAIIKGHRHFGYAGDVAPDNVSIQQYYDLTPMKRSFLRATDQLERMIKVSVPREHPYQSHISHYTLFPVPNTHTHSPLPPPTPPHCVVLSKTKGSPYRHEIVMVPMSTERKRLCWPWQDHTPESPGMVRPNTLQPHWNNSHYMSTYQQQFTGGAPAGPLKLDRLPDIPAVATVMGDLRPYAVQMRAASPRVLVPPRPPSGRSSPGGHAPLIREHARTLQPISSQDMNCTAYEDMDGKAPPTSASNSRGRLELREELMFTTADTGAYSNTLPHTLHSPTHTLPHTLYTPTHTLHTTPHTLSHTLYSPTHTLPHTLYTPTHTLNTPPHTLSHTLHTPTYTLPHTLHSPTHTLPPTLHSPTHTFPPTLHTPTHTLPPTLHTPTHTLSHTLHTPTHTLSHTLHTPTHTLHTLPPIHRLRQERGALSWLDLQNSFSRTEAHHRFHQSNHSEPVDLRENSCSGRRHTFYGVHACCLH
ncbi:sperm-associated microtubule inner protein 4 isoform X2 [Sardina pilchardus]|uniref:sperm-associated microtubule inner protein 4 isoform X2 n=1 Tax=Sardina pilchardus TaxID=27697 RepID=UPI002E14D505